MEETLTVPRLNAYYKEWRDRPPTNELFAAYVGYEKSLTAEESLEQGAMGPEDFARYVKATGGRTMGPGV